MYAGPTVHTSPRLVPLASRLSGLLFGLIALTAQALEIFPVRVEAGATESVASMQVRNTRADSMQVQIDVLEWRQDQNQDQLQPATDVMVVPRLLDLAPGARQHVRIGLTGGDRGRQRSYRLRIREIPPPPKPDFVGVRTVLEFSVPVFFDAAGAVAPLLQWRGRRSADGTIMVSAANLGGTYALFSHLRLLGAGDAVLAESSRPHYVLAGAEHGWPLALATPTAPTPSDLRLALVSNGREQIVALTLD
jgi:fimbrial chaperone protein